MTTHVPVIVSNSEWQDLIGIQYALGGSDPKLGLSCYGLVRQVYQGLQIALPEYQQPALDAGLAVEAAGNDWTRLDAPQPFAVTLIRSEGNASEFHLAIVTPELTLLHSLPKKGVVVSSINKYADRIIGFYRYTPGQGERLPLADGDAGRVIGMIALTVATIYTGGAVGAAYGAFWGAMAATAVSIGGNMILNLVAPIKPEGNALSGYTGDLADSRSYTWDGIQNDARQGLSKAQIFGVIKAGGQIISEKTWFDDTNNEYLDMLICPCHGKTTRLKEVQLNDTSETMFKNTGISVRNGDDEQALIDIFENIYLQYSSGAKIAYDASETAPTNVTEFTTKQPVTGVLITLVAPNGIYEMPAATPVPSSVNFNVQYRKKGTATWIGGGLDPVVVDNEGKFYFRTNIAFTGESNLWLLTDNSTYGLFSYATISGDFRMSADDVVYYCTQSGEKTLTTLGFYAFSDSGRTTPVTTLPDAGVVVQIYPDNMAAVPNPQQWPAYYYYNQSAPKTWATGPILSMQTAVAIKGINFHLYMAPPAGCKYVRVFLYSMRTSASKWTTHPIGFLEFGNGSSDITALEQEVSFTGLVTGYYRFAVEIDPVFTIGTQPTVESFQFTYVTLDSTSTTNGLSIAADSTYATRRASKQVEVSGLDEAVYDFRIWRTTVDEGGVTWQDDVYLRSYAEIIAKQLHYPNHTLLGVRTMATDRLSGGRPKITSVAVAAPLTVPAAEYRYSTTCTSDGGVVSSYSIINGESVTGVRQIVIPIDLGNYDGTGYLWMVRMDSAGFAQPDRLLTKHFLRVENWAAASGSTTLYIRSSESIPATTPLMIFHEAADPYLPRHTAWATAKMLIDGSHGRITEAGIDWTAFAEWDVWNMELKNGEPRHLFDAVVDFNTDLWSLAMKTAQTGRGHVYKRGNKYSVWVDKAASHVQLFGEGNSKNVTVNPIPRSDRANILTTSFINEAANYDQEDISRDDVQGNEYPIVKSIPVQVGIVRESQVVDLLDYMLLQNRYVGSAISLEAGIDSLEVGVGNVFMVASQAKDSSLSGRVVDVNTGTVELDQPFTPEEGITYQLSVWGTDGTLYTWTGTLSRTDITTLTAPESLPNCDHYEYPYVLCKVTEERMKYRCIGIKRVADTMHATLVGIEYRDEVYLND